MQLTADQLAGAEEVPAGKAVSDFACFDANVALAGDLPTLLLDRVCTSDGKSLEGKDRVDLYTLLLPLVVGLGQGGADTMADHMRAAERQESGATGAAAAKRVIGARALLTEVLHALRDFVKETGNFLVLPAVPTSGKAPARGSGSTPAAVAPVSASGAGAASAAVTTGPAEVLSTFLTVLQVTRNIDGAYTWDNLRSALVAAHQIMTAVGEPAMKIKVIADAVSRGDRLVLAICRTSGDAAGVHVLEMFTNLLPNAHGAANDLLAADVARISKSVGGVYISSTGVGMGGLGYGQPFLPGPLPPPLFPGARSERGRSGTRIRGWCDGSTDVGELTPDGGRHTEPKESSAPATPTRKPGHSRFVRPVP